MSEYTFQINGEYKTVEAEGLEDALREAGIGKDDEYELVESDVFKDKCILAAITDETLFGS